MKIGIFFDTLVTMGGAEKVVVQLANQLGAEIVTSGYNPDKLILKPKNKVHDLGNWGVKLFAPIGYLFEAPVRFWLNRNKFDYDLEIYIGFTSIYGVRKNRNSAWYCLTPNRIIYDLRHAKLKQQGLLGKAALWAHILLFGAWDKRVVSRFKHVLCQTKNVQRRFERYYGKRDISVVYAPVDTGKYLPGKTGDYFLAVSRLFPEKRMSLIAEAFAGRSEKLVLVGDGPERARIAQLATQNPNIELRSNLSEAQLKDLYENCRATIYMPVDEDYGLVPIEGMAAGKPCVAVNEGGCKETVADGTTGFLISPDVASIRAAVDTMTKQWVDAHADACMAQAKKFDLATCVAAIKEKLHVA